LPGSKGLLVLKKNIPLELIAPCGMNCNLCSAYLREEKYIVKCPECKAEIITINLNLVLNA